MKKKTSRKKKEVNKMPEEKMEDKLKAPVGDKPGNYSGNLNQAKIKVAEEKPTSAAISLPLNQPGDKLEKGIYQIKDGYFIDVLSFGADDVVRVKKGIVEKGMISWKPEYKIQGVQLLKFINKNKPESTKED